MCRLSGRNSVSSVHLAPLLTARARQTAAAGRAPPHHMPRLRVALQQNDMVALASSAHRKAFAAPQLTTSEARRWQLLRFARELKKTQRVGGGKRLQQALHTPSFQLLLSTSQLRAAILGLEVR